MARQKTRYRVKGKGVSLLLYDEDKKDVRQKTFSRGEEFDAHHQEIPTGFADLVEVIGPADLAKKVVEELSEEIIAAGIDDEEEDPIPPRRQPSRLIQEKETLRRKTTGKK